MRLLFYNIYFALGVMFYSVCGGKVGKYKDKGRPKDKSVEIKIEKRNDTYAVNYVVPRARIQLLYPRGFCISVPGCSSIKKVELDIEVITRYRRGPKKLDVRFFRRIMEKRDLYGRFTVCLQNCPWKQLDRIRYNMKQVLEVNGKIETHEAIFLSKISTAEEGHTVVKEVYSYTPALTELQYLGMRHQLMLNQYKFLHEKRMNALKCNTTRSVKLSAEYYYEYSDNYERNNASTKPTRSTSTVIKPFRSTAHPYLAREIYKKIFKDRIYILSTLPYHQLIDDGWF